MNNTFLIFPLGLLAGIALFAIAVPWLMNIYEKYYEWVDKKFKKKDKE